MSTTRRTPDSSSGITSPPSIRAEDFQDYPLWRTCTREMLTYMARRYEGHIIVPMTITNRAYYDEIIGGLSGAFDVRHIILYADRETLLRRLASRLEGPRSWAAQQIDRCLAARPPAQCAGHRWGGGPR